MTIIRLRGSDFEPRLVWHALRGLGALVAALVVSGCTAMIPGTAWQPKKDLVGPFTSHGSASQVLWRCESGLHWMGGGPCQVAFGIEAGERVELDELNAEIDDFMYQRPQLRPWIAPTDLDGAGHIPWNHAPAPYRLHLLTIHPTVILAVPTQYDAQPQCLGSLYRAGCYASMRRDEVFESISPIKKVAGSVWFSPTLDASLHPVPPDADQYSIHLPASRIDMKAVNGNWQIVRTAMEDRE